MDDTSASIFFIVLGLCGILFNKKIARGAVDFQYRTIHKQYSERPFRIGFCLSGSAFILWGILVLLNII
jgi:hypothetical protein